MITTADIEKLSQLARIAISDKEKASLAEEIEAILTYVAEIQTASADAPVKEDYLRNVFRDDVSSHESGIFTETLLKASPDREGQYFKVKKIL